MLVLLDAWNKLECMPAYSVKALVYQITKLPNNYQLESYYPTIVSFTNLFTIIYFDSVLCSSFKTTSIVIESTKYNLRRFLFTLMFENIMMNIHCFWPHLQDICYWNCILNTWVRGISSKDYIANPKAISQIEDKGCLQYSVDK